MDRCGAYVAGEAVSAGEAADVADVAEVAEVAEDLGGENVADPRQVAKAGALSLGDHVEVRGRVTPHTRMLNVKRIVHLGSGAVIVPRPLAAARNAKAVPWMVLVGMLLVAIRCILDPAVTLGGRSQR